MISHTLKVIDHLDGAFGSLSLRKISSYNNTKNVAHELRTFVDIPKFSVLVLYAHSRLNEYCVDIKHEATVEI